MTHSDYYERRAKRFLLKALRVIIILLMVLIVLPLFTGCASGPMVYTERKPDGTRRMLAWGGGSLLENTAKEQTKMDLEADKEGNVTKFSTTVDKTKKKQTGAVEVWGNTKLGLGLAESTNKGQQIEANRQIGLEAEKGKQLQTLSNGTVIEAPQQVIYPPSR